MANSIQLGTKELSIEKEVLKISENNIIIFKTDVSFNENSQLSEIYSSKEEFLREFIFSIQEEHDLSDLEKEEAINFVLQS